MLLKYKWWFLLWGSLTLLKVFEKEIYSLKIRIGRKNILLTVWCIDFNIIFHFSYFQFPIVETCGNHKTFTETFFAIPEPGLNFLELRSTIEKEVHIIPHDLWQIVNFAQKFQRKCVILIDDGRYLNYVILYKYLFIYLFLITSRSWLYGPFSDEQTSKT